jgi:hypothetical protein
LFEPFDIPIKSMSLTTYNGIKTHKYTTIANSKLKERLKELVQMCFMRKNCQGIYTNKLFRKRQILFCNKKAPL